MSSQQPPPGWQPPAGNMPPSPPPDAQPPGNQPPWPGQPPPPYGMPPGGYPPGPQPYPPPYPPQQYQQPYAPPPPGYYGPPPTQKRSGFLGGLGVGCLIAVGLTIVAIIAIITISAVVINRASRAVVNSLTYPDVHVRLVNGASGTVRTSGAKTHIVTIVGINDNARSTDPSTQPQAGNRYVAVQVVVENAGTSESSPGDWTLDTTDGSVFDRSFVAGIGQGLSVNIAPGGKTQGTIIFEIPVGAKVQWIRYDPNIYATGDLYFDTT